MKKPYHLAAVAGVIALGLGLAACSSSSSSNNASSTGLTSSHAACPHGTLAFGVEPYDNASVLIPAYQALAADLGHALGCKVNLQIADSYVAEILAMKNGKLDMGEFGPAGFVFALQQAGAVPLASFADKNGQLSTYTAGIWVKKGSPITSLKQLAGRADGDHERAASPQGQRLHLRQDQHLHGAGLHAAGQRPGDDPGHQGHVCAALQPRQGAQPQFLRSVMTSLTTSPVLSVRGLTKRFGDRVVVEGFDLDVKAEEVVSILGANGSGKSTMLRCLSGLTRFDAGSVSVAGREVRSGKHVPEFAMVFQKIHLVPQLSALENVCAGALGRLSFWQAWAPRAFPADVREEAMGCLDRVGLAERAHDRARRLSGGQQQRVAVARALCQRAGVLLADEPVSSLDPAAAEQVMRLLRSLADDDGMAVAAVLHQPDLARRHSDRVVGLTGGRITLNIPPSALTDADVDALYAPDYAAEGGFS